MGFVKLDCGMLDSSIWPDRHARELFLTSLLMAKPKAFLEVLEQIEVRSLERTGHKFPPGNYGYVEASGTGIIRRSGMDSEDGLSALERLCDCDPESRTPEHCGKRMARVEGGYIILNFQKYRDKDHTAAVRQKNLRSRKRTGIDSMIEEQGGFCDCCRKPFETPYSRYVVMDHCHKTLTNRALVCQSCNRLVGMVENGQSLPNSAEQKMASRYIERHARNASDITQAEGEAEGEGNAYQKPEPERASLLSPCDGDGFGLMTPEARRVLSEEIYSSYPRPKKGEHKELGLEAIERVALYLIRERPKDFSSERSAFRFLMKRTEEFASSPEVKGKIALGTTDKIPMAKNWFSDHRFDDEIF